MSPRALKIKPLTRFYRSYLDDRRRSLFKCPSFNFIGAEFIFKRATTPPRLKPGGVVAPRCISFTGGRYAAALARAMALPLTFTASSEGGLSRSRAKRRLNRYRRSSDALKRRRFAYSALHCARRRVCPPRLMSANPAPIRSTPVAQVLANTLGQRHVARTAKPA